MNILVTGASGYVGRLVVSKFLESEKHTCFQSLRNGSVRVQGVQARAVDQIEDLRQWRDVLGGMDAVIHLGAIAHGRDVSRSQMKRINVGMTECIAGAARECGVGKMIFLSTSEVSGNVSSEIINEESTDKPENAYAEDKLEAETAIREILGGSKTGYTILRAPAIFGGSSKGRLSSMIRLAKRGVPLPLTGVRAKRTLLFVGNLLDVIEICIERKGIFHESFCIADNEELSLEELIRSAATAEGWKPRLLNVPESFMRFSGHLMDLPFRLKGTRPFASALARVLGSCRVDNALIKSTLNWNPRWTTCEGFKASRQFEIVTE